MTDDLVKRLREGATWDDDIAAADRIEELEAKLAKAVEALEGWVNVYTHCTIKEGVCCCGDDMNGHKPPMNCGHTPLDHGDYIASGLAKQTETTLAELKGEQP